MPRYVLTVFLLVFSSFALRGQPHYFKHFQVDQGLSHNSVTCIIQDRLGFIWVGTKGGLDRFDGHEFEDITLDPGTAGANHVTSLYEDRRGKIWIGTISGLFRFDPRSGRCERVPQSPALRVADIREDTANQVWFIAGGRLYKYNGQTSRITALNLQASAIEIDSEGGVWIGGRQGAVKKVDAETNQTTPVEQPRHQSINRGLITCMAAMNQFLIVGTTRGLWRLDRRTAEWKPLLTKNSQGADVFVRDIEAVKNEGKYYIATESGLFVYDYGKDRFESVEKVRGDPYSLNDNAVYTVCVDNRNGVWLGTFFGGVNFYSRENGSFEKYSPLPANASISGNAVREICGDDEGNVWIGTEDAGITKFNPKTGFFEHLVFGDPRTGISYPNIHGLLVDGGHLYAGPFVHGLEVMDLASGKVVDRYPDIRTRDSLFASNFVMSIYKIRDGRILVGTTGAGLYWYDLPSRTLTQVQEIPKRSYVYAIFEDHAGIIWTGSLSSGVFYFNPKTGEHGNVNFSIDSADRRFYTIQGIHEDRNRALWFTSEGGGLIRLDSSRTGFRRYTKADGLPTEYTYRMLEDRSGRLWISSLKGLICFNPQTEDINVYTQANGLITDQFNYSSAYKTADGKMYFGTVKGMVAFTPENLVKNTQPPPLYITGLQVGDTKIRPKDSLAILGTSALVTDSVTLDYKHSSFEIAFAALDFAAPSAIRYRYRMEGFEDKWTYLSSNRKAYYTGLPAGTYRFVVTAESNVGYWKTKPKSLVVTVLPPLWKSWPAYVCYALAVLLLVASTVYYYHRNVKRRNARRLKLRELEMEKEAYRSKIEFFTNIAHEIRTPLTLIKGPVEWAYDKAEDAGAVKRNLTLVKNYTDRLVALTTQLLDFRKAEINQFSLNFAHTDIGMTTANLIADFTPEAEKRDIVLRAFGQKMPLMAAVDREAFVKIVSNLLSNAIKYADQYVSVEWEEDAIAQQFSVIVANDGEIIPEKYREKIFEPFFRIPSRKEVQGTGIGLSLARSLADLHDGTLDVIVDETALNIFVLTLPTNQQGVFRLNPQTNEVGNERDVAHN